MRRSVGKPSDSGGVILRADERRSACAARSRPNHRRPAAASLDCRAREAAVVAPDCGQPPRQDLEGGLALHDFVVIGGGVGLDGVHVRWESEAGSESGACESRPHRQSPTRAATRSTAGPSLRLREAHDDSVASPWAPLTRFQESRSARCTPYFQTRYRTRRRRTDTPRLRGPPSRSARPARGR